MWGRMDEKRVTGSLSDDRLAQVKRKSYKFLGLILIITVGIAAPTLLLGRYLDAKNGSMLKWTIVCGLAGILIAIPVIAIAAKKIAGEFRQMMEEENKGREKQDGGNNIEC